MQFGIDKDFLENNTEDTKHMVLIFIYLNKALTNKTFLQIYIHLDIPISQ